MWVDDGIVIRSLPPIEMDGRFVMFHFWTGFRFIRTVYAYRFGKKSENGLLKKKDLIYLDFGAQLFFI